MGTSSGGHLVVLAALKPNDPRYASIPCAGGGDSRVPFVVALWPVICPASRWRAYQASPGAMGNRGRAASQQIGYWLTEAAMEEGSADMAVNRGDAIDLPHILYLQNPADPMHPFANLESFVAGYRKRGGQVRLELFAGEKYDAVRSDPDSAEARAAIAKIVAFIRAEATARVGAAAKQAGGSGR